MSLLLKDRVWSMEASTAKRGVYPLHGFKLGLYRLPITLEDPDEIKSVHDGLKKAFEMDAYADRIFATYRWKEQNMDDPDAKGYEEVELSVTVEIVTGEVVDIIYQIFPIEKFGDPQWVKDYRKKADHFAKMIIDTILRNTILADKMIDFLIKDEKITELNATLKLEEMTPLAKIVLDAKPKPKPVEEVAGDEGGADIPVLDGPKSGPIDVDYKSKMKATAPYSASGHSIKTWGRNLFL
jgi:hypothetical protein